MKCFSMRMTFDLLDKLLNSEMFCFFHNCMWQSWYSEVNVVLLHFYGSHRSCLIFFNFCRHQHATFCGIHLRVSPFLIIGFLVLVGFVGCLCCFQRLLNPIPSSNHFSRKSSEAVEVIQKLFRSWFLQFPSGQLSGYNKLGVYHKGWLHYILFDRTSILSVEQAVYRPNTQCLWCLFHFCLYDARRGLVKSSSCGSLWSLSMGFTAVKNTVCLSLPKFCPPSINPEFMMECKLTAHPMWWMYSKKLFGINTFSWSVGSMGLRPEWPWRARK